MSRPSPRHATRAGRDGATALAGFVRLLSGPPGQWPTRGQWRRPPTRAGRSAGSVPLIVLKLGGAAGTRPGRTYERRRRPRRPSEHGASEPCSRVRLGARGTDSRESHIKGRRLQGVPSADPAFRSSGPGGVPVTSRSTCATRSVEPRGRFSGGCDPAGVHVGLPACALLGAKTVDACVSESQAGFPSPAFLIDEGHLANAQGCEVFLHVDESRAKGDERFEGPRGHLESSPVLSVLNLPWPPLQGPRFVGGSAHSQSGN
jgi:hypothetical protein